MRTPLKDSRGGGTIKSASIASNGQTMRPLIHSRLINPPFGDPGVYLEFMYERRAMLLDLGDLSPLSDRNLLNVRHIMVSHTHMDHFGGLDRLIRILLGRDRTLHLFGPPGFIERVSHRLASYTWNLVSGFKSELVLMVGEYHPDGSLRMASLNCREAFAVELLDREEPNDGVLLDGREYRVRATVLDHGIPCLGFAVEQKRHVNVWKNKVEEMGLRVGPWLHELKLAILGDEPPDRPFTVTWRDDEGRERQAVYPLGELDEKLTQTQVGQKLAYVTDVRWSEDNREKIVKLARDADLLYIEAPFLDEDAEIAASKNHLTAAQAGRLGREAGARRLVPFHFSPRYSDREAALRAEVAQAFGGAVGAAQDEPE